VQNIPVCANAVGGNFLISRDVLGKWLGEKNRRWGKFLEITANSAPLLKNIFLGVEINLIPPEEQDKMESKQITTPVPEKAKEEQSK
jgi:hypothetical protein